MAFWENDWIRIRIATVSYTVLGILELVALLRYSGDFTWGWRGSVYTAFVVSVLVCFLFTISGAPLVLDFFQNWAPVVLVNTISSFSFLTHFQAISSGVIGRCGDMVGVWIEPVTAQVMMTLFDRFTVFNSSCEASRLFEG